MKFEKAVFVNIAESHFDKNYWDQLDGLYEQKVLLTRDDPELMNELKDCDVLLLGFQVPVDKDIFDAAPNLKLINILATAYGTVNLEEAAKRNIIVCNLGGYSTEAVAEFTIAVLLYHIRQLEEGVKRGRAGNYDIGGMSARELKGSNFGVVGLGSIGGRVAELAAGFEADVSYWSRNKKDAPYSYKELNDLLASSDYISVNVALAPDTENLLCSATIPIIKPGAVVISTVPPEVIDTDALATRLAKGDITYISTHGGNMSEENRSKVTQYQNCLLLPAIGFVTAEAQMNKQEIFVGNMTSFLEGKAQNKVN